MKVYNRRQEMIKSCIYLIIGLMALYLVSSKLQAINIDDETEIISVEVESESVPSNEKIFAVDAEAIYERHLKTLNEDSVMQLLKDYLPGGKYLKKVLFNKENKPSSLSIIYMTDTYNQVFSKDKKDQLVLLEASILMSLYESIDTVEINIWVESDLYSKVLCRADLEDYFGLSIGAMGDKKNFECIAKEFLDLKCVENYWNSKHPYDSYLGEEVESFFKKNFPIVEKVEDTFPYIDEELGSALIEEYGYKLFLQGLQYENPLINYYSVYRLLECYGNANRDELMLEITICKLKSQDKRVKKACDEVIELLVPLKENETRVIQRFGESEFGGGERLYTMDNAGLHILAQWEGEEVAGLKILSKLQNGKYILCEAKTLHQNYQYILDVNNKKTYTLNEDGVYYNGSKVRHELCKKLDSDKDLIEQLNIGME